MAGERFREPILHLDMDAFFVEVERLRAPHLHGRPVAVGGTGPRGVAASASYEARACGVRSAMPIRRALRLCPELIVVPPDHGEYRRLSGGVFEILHRFTPLVEAVSIDEAFLDVSGLWRHHPHVRAVAEEIRAAIRGELGLPSSVGVAASKLVAKLASQDAKPDGLFLVPANAVDEFLSPLPVRRLWGVGEVILAKLESLGVRTIGELARIPEKTLAQRIGASVGSHLHELALGRDDRAVVAPADPKSVSIEVTYDTDLTDCSQLKAELLHHAERVADRLRRGGLAGRTVTLKVRFADFVTTSRSRTFATATDVGRDIYQTACLLLEDVPEGPVRLLGVALSALEERGGPQQLEFDRPASWDDLADAVGEVRDRFGSEAVGPARFAREGHRPHHDKEA